MRSLLPLGLIALLLLSMLASIALAWEMERPAITFTFAEREESYRTNGVASVGLGVDIGTYHIDDPKYVPYDYLNLKIAATSNTREGFSYDVWDSGEKTVYEWHKVLSMSLDCWHFHLKTLRLAFSFHLISMHISRR